MLQKCCDLLNELDDAVEDNNRVHSIEVFGDGSWWIRDSHELEDATVAGDSTGLTQASRLEELIPALHKLIDERNLKVEPRQIDTNTAREHLTCALSKFRGSGSRGKRPGAATGKLEVAKALGDYAYAIFAELEV